MTWTPTDDSPAVRAPVEWPDGVWMLHCPYCHHFFDRKPSIIYNEVRDTPENHICREWVKSLVTELIQAQGVSA